MASQPGRQFFIEFCICNVFENAATDSYHITSTVDFNVTTLIRNLYNGT